MGAAALVKVKPGQRSFLLLQHFLSLTNERWKKAGFYVRLIYTGEIVSIRYVPIAEVF